MSATRLLYKEEDLKEVFKFINQQTIVAVDLEGEWNLHRYGMHLCLIQMKAGGESWLIDPLEKPDLTPFISMMENPALLKISHGTQSDIILLNKLFGARPKNIFDTQRASQLLGYANTSLGGLLEVHFGTKKNDKLREMDWHKRPIEQKLLEYALRDVEHLEEIYTILNQKLIALNRTEWIKEENGLLEEITWQPKENPFFALKGASRLLPKSKRMLKSLFFAREEIAKILNKPPGYVIGNQHLLELSENPPETEKEWKNLRSVHPSLKNYSEKLAKAVEEGNEGPIPKWEKEEPSYNPGLLNGKEKAAFEERKEKLSLIRDEIEKDYEDIHPLILSMKTAMKLAFGMPTNEIRAWQVKIILHTAKILKIKQEEIFSNSPKG